MIFRKMFNARADYDKNSDKKKFISDWGDVKK
jgi:hypothetical protein